jgi:hypothetical protein
LIGALLAAEISDARGGFVADFHAAQKDFCAMNATHHLSALGVYSCLAQQTIEIYALIS